MDSRLAHFVTPNFRPHRFLGDSVDSRLALTKFYEFCNARFWGIVWTAGIIRSFCPTVCAPVFGG